MLNSLLYVGSSGVIDSPTTGNGVPDNVFIGYHYTISLEAIIFIVLAFVAVIVFFTILLSVSTVKKNRIIAKLTEEKNQAQQQAQQPVYVQSNPYLSPEEQALLQNYRQLSYDKKALIQNNVNAMLPTNNNIQKGNY